MKYKSEGRKKRNKSPVFDSSFVMYEYLKKKKKRRKKERKGTTEK